MSYDRKKIKNLKTEFIEIGCPSPYNEKYVMKACHPNGGISVVFNYIKFFQDLGEWFYDNQEAVGAGQQEDIVISIREMLKARREK